MKDFTMDPVTTGSNDSRWCEKWKNQYIFPLFTAILLLIPFNDIFAQKNTAENVQGVAPVITPHSLDNTIWGFEIDGNAQVDIYGDWFGLPSQDEGLSLFMSDLDDTKFNGEEPVFDSNYQEDVMSFFLRDDISNLDPTVFDGSNKINDDPNTYEWKVGSVPKKNEIQTVAVHFTYGAETHPEWPEPEGTYTDGDDLWIIFAGDREDINGSSYIDFELLQQTLTKNPDGTFTSDASPLTGGRTVGDLLVTLEFTQGGATAKVVVREWKEVGGEYMYVLAILDTPEKLHGIFASVNELETIVPWSVYHTEPISTNPNLYQYQINQWAEGAVNLSAFFPQDDPCFQISTLFIRTRTSGSSGQSELKDFPGDPIQLNIDLTPPAPEVADVENCGPWEGTLVATGCEGTVKWYDAETDGTLLHTGSSFEFMALNAITETTSFWVSCTVDGCEGPRAMVTVTIYDIPDFDVTNLESCEVGETGAASFDLNDAISNEDMGSLSFYNSEADAMVPENAIGVPTDVSVLIADSAKTFWARLDNDDDGDEDCHTIKSFTVTVYDNPDLMVDDLADCEDGTTGAQDFDLDDAVTDDDDGTVTFYGSLADANVPQNAISNSQNVTIAASPKTFWARSDNDSDGDEGCFTVKSFTVTVYDNPAPTAQNLADCEVGSTGSATFDLDDAITDADGGTVTFYASEADALVPQNPIAGKDTYSSAGGETIWVRSSASEGCFGLTSFTISVYDNPDLMVQNLDDCEDGTTGAQTFDLNDAVTDDDGGTVSFYTSMTDADDAINPIANPAMVSVSLLESPKTFWARSDNDSDGDEDCYSVESFTVTVYDNPDVTTSNPDPICLGESVDLANYVTDGDGGTLSYHSTLLDAEGDMNALMSTIVSPGLGSHDYFVRSENISDAECYSVATITVTVITCIVDQGCTLGYWKNHTDRWCDAYQTCDFYGDVFANAPDELAGLTLQAVLDLGGGGIYNLARQSVAALLNTCSDEVGFYYTDVEVLIAYVNNAFASGDTAISMAGMNLDGLNNQYCPLGGTSATTAPSEDCVDPSSLKVAEGDALNNDTSVVVNSFSVSPVPFRESLSVKYDFDYVSDAVIQMYDMQGRLLSTQKEANASKGKITNLSINFRTLPSQVYVIKVTTDRDVFTKKIVSDK